jgi:hypothetical protein
MCRSACRAMVQCPTTCRKEGEGKGDNGVVGFFVIRDKTGERAALLPEAFGICKAHTHNLASWACVCANLDGHLRMRSARFQGRLETRPNQPPGRLRLTQAVPRKKMLPENGIAHALTKKRHAGDWKSRLTNLRVLRRRRMWWVIVATSGETLPGCAYRTAAGFFVVGTTSILRTMNGRTEARIGAFRRKLLQDY